jgi:hypothetical protein
MRTGRSKSPRRLRSNLIRLPSVPGQLADSIARKAGRLIEVPQSMFDVFALALPAGLSFGDKPPVGAWRSDGEFSSACAVYPERPLVCAIFGAAGSRFRGANSMAPVSHRLLDAVRAHGGRVAFSLASEDLVLHARILRGPLRRALHP